MKFLHACTNSGKIKVVSMIFRVGMVKNGADFLIHETLKYVV